MAGRRTWLAVMLALATLPAGARAADYCVPNTAIAGCPADGLQATDFATAVAHVNAGAVNDPNTITLGANASPYTSDNLTIDYQHPVAIVGAGATQTVLEADPGSNSVLDLDNSSSSISGVGFVVPDNAVGLITRGGANHIAVRASQTGQGVTGVFLVGFDGPTLSNSTVSLPFSATVSNTAVESSSTGTTVQNTAVVQGSTISGAVGLDHVAVILRDRITANVGYQAASAQVAPSAVFDDDLILTRAGTAPEAGIEAAPIYASPPTLTIRHVTLIGDGASGSVGVGLLGGSSFVGPDAEAVTANIDSSIIRGYSASLSAVASGGSQPAYAQSDVSTINVAHSDYDTKRTMMAAGVNPGSTASATINVGIGVTTAAPQFGTTAAGDPLAYHQLMSSPGTDTGDPALAAGEPATDLDGARRVASTGTTDMGPFEHTPAAPRVALTAAPGRPAAGRLVALRAVATDANPGDRFTYRWAIDGRATAGGATLEHRFARAGRHTVSVEVAELDGLQTTATISLVVAGPLADLRLSPRSFARAGRGTVISYVDPVGVRASLKVQRRERGRWVTVGTFTHRDAPGANRFRFTARVGGHRLAPGRYRLLASDGTGKPAARGFTIRG